MKTFEQVELGEKLLYSHSYFLCDTICRAMTVKRKTYMNCGCTIKFECDNHTFYVPSDKYEVIDEIDSFEKCKIEIL